MNSCGLRITCTCGHKALPGEKELETLSFVHGYPAVALVATIGTHMGPKLHYRERQMLTSPGCLAGYALITAPSDYKRIQWLQFHHNVVKLVSCDSLVTTHI